MISRKKTKGRAPQKKCPKCKEINFARQIACTNCFHTFPKMNKSRKRNKKVKEEKTSKSYFASVLLHAEELEQLTGSTEESIKMLRIISGLKESIKEDNKKKRQETNKQIIESQVKDIDGPQTNQEDTRQTQNLSDMPKEISTDPIFT